MTSRKRKQERKEILKKYSRIDESTAFEDERFFELRSCFYDSSWDRSDRLKGILPMQPWIHELIRLRIKKNLYPDHLLDRALSELMLRPSHPINDEDKKKAESVIAEDLKLPQIQAYKNFGRADRLIILPFYDGIEGLPNIITPEMSGLSYPFAFAMERMIGTTNNFFVPFDSTDLVRGWVPLEFTDGKIKVLTSFENPLYDLEEFLKFLRLNDELFISYWNHKIAVFQLKERVERV
jgi:hypothetical protein